MSYAGLALLPAAHHSTTARCPDLQPQPTTEKGTQEWTLPPALQHEQASDTHTSQQPKSELDTSAGKIPQITLHPNMYDARKNRQSRQPLLCPDLEADRHRVLEHAPYQALTYCGGAQDEGRHNARPDIAINL